MIIILLPSIMNSPLFRLIAPPDYAVPPASQQPITASPGDIPSVITILAFICSGLVIVSAIYIMLIKLPRSVAKTGETITHGAATIISPIITEHVPMHVKRRRTVPIVVIIIMKLLCVFAPLCLLLFAQGLSLAMSFELIMVIGIVLFSWAFLLFALQFVLSQLLRVDYKTIR